jgi:hypothetical protein
VIGGDWKGRERLGRSGPAEPNRGGRRIETGTRRKNPGDGSERFQRGGIIPAAGSPDLVSDVEGAALRPVSGGMAASNGASKRLSIVRLQRESEPARREDRGDQREDGETSHDGDSMRSGASPAALSESFEGPSPPAADGCSAKRGARRSWGDTPPTRIIQYIEGGNFSPDQPITRKQKAAFLAKALGLHWPH